MKADIDAPEHVHVTGRVNRLQVPVLTRGSWRIVRVVLLAMLLPVALFFLILFMLKHR